jgi:hypothetical protein
MSKGVCDVFALVIIFLGSNWKPKHVYLNLLGLYDKHWGKKLTNILDDYNLKNKIRIGSNLNTTTSCIKSILKCEVIGLEENLQGTCFGHDSSKLATKPLVMKKFVRALYVFP